MRHIFFITIYLTLVSPLMSAVKTTQTKELAMLLEVEKASISIFQKSVKSVVHIANIKVARSRYRRKGIDVPNGAGTGWVWDKKGHIVTNYHVVAGGDKFIISFYKDKIQYEAKIIGFDKTKDIAVLKLIKIPKLIVPISLGSSESLMVGQMAFALGNPFGLDSTLTRGIISSTDRKIEGVGNVEIYGMIQTDASINPGNSGGPLINSSGKMIGMNTMIFSQSGSSAGVGFAVPIDSISRVVPQIIKHGKVIRPSIGISYNQYLQRVYELDQGVIIDSVHLNSPAYKAGLVGIEKDQWGRLYLGDIILRVNGKKVNNFNQIYHALDGKKIGDEIEIKFLRGRKIKTVKINLEALE